MVRITEDLIRKRAEHNEMLLSTLEEVSLHQQDIERIEYIDKWCKELKILYLQSNLIPKIENVSKLKKLEYLNLALNNVEKVENLEGCESLNKLDLTVNFVGELTSIESLRENYNLRELYLVGNPCAEFDGYRPFVIATLPQLKTLDGKEVEKSERIEATQMLTNLRPWIKKQEEKHRKIREKEREEARREELGEQPEEKKHGFDGKWYTNIDGKAESKKEEAVITEVTDEEAERILKEEELKKKQEKPLTVEEELKLEEEKDKAFWGEKTSYTPESRVKVHEYMKEKRSREEKKKEEPKAPRRLETEDGRMLNVNEAKVDFEMQDTNENLILDVAVFKHMDSSLIDADVHPTYVRVILKGKILQLVLPEEVKPDSSTAKRSQTSGHLVITMPKLNPVTIPLKKIESEVLKNKTNSTQKPDCKGDKKIEKLEVDPSTRKTVDYKNIVKEKPTKGPLGESKRREVKERENSEDFVDDPDVPPLM